MAGEGQRGVKELLLVPEVAHRHRQVDARVAGFSADCGEQ